MDSPNDSSALSQPGPRSYAWLRFMILAAGLGLFAAQALTIAAGIHSNDFRHIYLGMQAITDGDLPYEPESILLQASRHGLGGASLNPYVYLPFTGLAMAFLKPLSFPQAELAWYALNLLLALLACALAVRGAVVSWLDRQHLASAVFGLLLVALAASHPYARTLTAGQLNIVLLACTTGGLWLILAGRWAIAGALLGFAAMFKIAPMIFLAYFALRGRWRGFIAMAATVALLSVMSLLLTSWDMHARFIPMLRDMGFGRSTWQEYGAVFWKEPTNQSINSLLTHVLALNNGVTVPWIESRQAIANRFTMAAALAVLGLYFVVGTGAGRTRSPLASRGDLAVFHLTSLVMLLLPSLLWDHYLVLALPAAAWLATEAWLDGRWSALLFAAICWLLIAIPWPFTAEAFRSGPMVPLMSMKLFPLLALTAMVAWRGWTARPGPADPYALPPGA